MYRNINEIIERNIMQSWELAHRHVDSMEKEMEEKHKEYKWAAMVGTLQGNLSSIFITLSVYHPEAFERVLRQLDITI